MISLTLLHLNFESFKKRLRHFMIVKIVLAMLHCIALAFAAFVVNFLDAAVLSPS